MEPNRVDHLVDQLLQRRTGAGIKDLRRLMDKETARAVINHPRLTPEKRAAISLALNFGGADRWGRGDSCVFEAEEIEPSN